MLFAGGQRASAKRPSLKVEAFRVYGWTVVHSFYADIDGFIVFMKDSQPFPIRARLLHFQVRIKVIESDDNKGRVSNSSKADLLAIVI